MNSESLKGKYVGLNPDKLSYTAIHVVGISGKSDSVQFPVFCILVILLSARTINIRYYEACIGG
jgi:hypothetical protein